MRRLTQAAVPLSVVHPAGDMLLAYEIEMIRSDTQCPLFTYHAASLHPRLAQLLSSLAEDPQVWGPLEQVDWQRGTTVQLHDRQLIINTLAADCLILRRILGEVTSVSATGATQSGQQLGQLSVFLTGAGERTARWTLNPGPQPSGARLTVRGQHQCQILHFSADGNDCWVEASSVSDEARHAAATVTVDDPAAPLAARHCLQRVVSSLRGGTRVPTAGLEWTDVCRTLEITDAVERSIQRRRTIELYHEQVTEEETFKSIMAAGGCGLLLWVLLLLLVAGVVEGLQLPLRHAAIWRLYPVALLAPLAIFIGLQLLTLVFPRPVGE